MAETTALPVATPEPPVANGAASPATVFLSREQIFANDDSRIEIVDVPEWGGKIGIRSMSGTERDRWEAEISKTSGPDKTANWDNLRARLVAATAVDGEGRQVFSRDDVAALGKKNSAVLSRLFVVAQAMSGLGEDEIEALTKSLGKRPERRFWIELSFAYRTPVRQLQQLISSEEFTELQVYAAHNPISPLRHMAEICAAIANSVRDPEKRSSPWTWRDFAPGFATEQANALDAKLRAALGPR